MMENKSKRLFNSEFRKILLNKCQKLEKAQMIELYNIIKNDNKSCSSNKNGVYINLNQLSDYCIDEIVKFINDESLINSVKEIKLLNNINIIKQELIKNDININKIDKIDKIDKQEKTLGVSFSLGRKKQKVAIST